MRSMRGFTMVELIIAIAIVSVASAVAVPNIMVWRQNLELRGATRDVYSNFHRARVEAIKRRTYCSVTFRSDSYVIYEDSNKDLVKDDSEDIIASISLSDYGNLTLDTSEGGGDGLTFSNPEDGIAFSPSGISRSAAGFGSGSVYLKHGNNKTARVVVSSSGNIRIE